MEENKRKTNREKCETNSYKKKYQFFGKARTNSTDSYFVEEIVDQNNVRINSRDKIVKKNVKTNSTKKQSLKSINKKTSKSKKQDPFRLKTLNIVIKDLRRENLTDFLKKHCVKLGSASNKILKSKQLKHSNVVESNRSIINNISKSIKLIKSKSKDIVRNQPPPINKIKIKKKVSSVPPSPVNDKVSKELKLLLDTSYPLIENITRRVSRTSQQLNSTSSNQESSTFIEELQVFAKKESPKQHESKSTVKSSKQVEQLPPPLSLKPTKPVVDSKIIPPQTAKRSIKLTQVFPSPQLSKKELKLDKKLFKKYKCKQLKLNLKKIDKVLKMTSEQKTIHLTEPKVIKKVDNKSDKYKLKIKMKSSTHKKVESKTKMESSSNTVKHKESSKSKGKVDKEHDISLAARLQLTSPENKSPVNRLKAGGTSTPLKKDKESKNSTKSSSKNIKPSYSKSKILGDTLGLLKPLREEPESLLVPLKSVKVKQPSSSTSKIPKMKSSSISPKKHVKLDYKTKKIREQQNLKRRLRNAAIDLLQSPDSLSPKKSELKKKESKSKKDKFWSPFEYVEVKSMKAAPTFIEEVLPLPIPPVIPIAIPTEIPPLMDSNVIIENTPNIMVEVQPLDIIQTIATPSKAKIPQANAKRKIKYPTNRDIKRVRFCDTITVLNSRDIKKKKKSKSKSKSDLSKIQTVQDPGGEIQIQSVWGNADTVEQPAITHIEPQLEDISLSHRGLTHLEPDVEERSSRQSSESHGRPERRLRTAKKINYSDENSAFIDELLESQIIDHMLQPPKVVEQNTNLEKEKEVEKTAVISEENLATHDENLASKDENVTSKDENVTENVLPDKEKVEETAEPKDKVVQDCAVSSSSSNEQSGGGTIEPIPKLKLKLNTKKKKSSDKVDKPEKKERKSKKSTKKEKDKKNNSKTDTDSSSQATVSTETNKQPLPKLKIENINKNGETKLVIKKVNPQNTDKKPTKPKTKAELKIDLTKTIKRGPKPKTIVDTPSSLAGINKFDKLLNSPTKPSPPVVKEKKVSTFDSLIAEKKEKPPPPKPKTPPPPPKPKEPKIVTAETIAEFFATNIKKLSELNKNCNWGGIYEQAAYHFFDTTLTYYRHYLFNYWKSNSEGIQTILIPKLRPDQLDLNINVDNLFDAVAPEEETHSYNRGNRVEKIVKNIKQTQQPKIETNPPLTSPCAYASSNNPQNTKTSEQTKKPGEEENANSPKITFQNSPLNLSDSKQVEKDANSPASVLQVPEVNKYSTLTNFYNNAPSMLANDNLTRPEDIVKDSSIVVPQYVKSVPQTIIPTMTTMPLPKSSPYEIKNPQQQQQQQQLQQTSEGLKFVVTNVEHIQKDSRQSYSYAKAMDSNLQKYETQKTEAVKQPTYASYVKQVDNSNIQKYETQRNTTTPKPTYSSYQKPIDNNLPKYENQRTETPKPNYSSYTKSIESTVQKYESQKLENPKQNYSTYPKTIDHQKIEAPKPSYTPSVDYQKNESSSKNLSNYNVSHNVSLDTPRPDRAKSIDVYSDQSRNVPSPFLQKSPTSIVSHNLPRTTTAVDNQNYSYSVSNSSETERRNTNDPLNRLNYFNYTTNHSQGLPLESNIQAKLAKSFHASQLEAVKKSNFYYDMSKTYSPLQCVRSETPDNRSIHAQSPVIQKPQDKDIKDERNIPSTHSIQSPPPSTYDNQVRTIEKQKVNSQTSSSQQDYSVLPLSSGTERPSLMSIDFQQSYLLNNYYNASYSLQRSLESGFLGTTSNLLLPTSVAQTNEVNSLFPTEEVNQQYQQSQSNQLYSNVDNYMINSSDTQSTILLPNEAMIQTDTNTSYAMSENYSPTLLTLNAASTTDYQQTQDSNSYANWDKQQSKTPTNTWDKQQPQKSTTPGPVDQKSTKEKPKYRPLQGRYDETAKNVLTLHLDHSRLFNADCKFAKNYSTYLKEQIRQKYPYCHPLIGNTRLNKLGSAKVYVHCMDKDCLRFNCTLQSNIVDAVGLTPVEIKVYGELNQDKQKQLCRMVQIDAERLLVE